MFMYVPLGKGIVHSSLWEEPASVRVLFITMMTLMDRDNVVRMDERNLYRAAKLELEEFRAALKVLEAPDRRDPFEQPFDGRRIERHADGWLVLNGTKYQELMVEANRRAREAAKKRRQRENQVLRRQAKDARERKHEELMKAGLVAEAEKLAEPRKDGV